MRALIIAAATAFTLVLIVTPVRSDEPIGTSVTFNREIIRIFERRCLSCHHPGGPAMSLAVYREARLWARAIREELIEQRMPPWRAAPGYGAFAHDIGLTPRELTMLLTWADGGAPRGDDTDLPRRAALPATPPAPDETLALPPQRLAAGEEVVRRVVVDAGRAAGRALRQMLVIPGDRRVLRAVFVSVSGATPAAVPQWITAWTPWMTTLAPPEEVAPPLPPGARLIVDLHYRGSHEPIEDRTALQLFFAPEATAARQIVVDARRGRAVADRDTRVWAIVPELGPGTQSLEVSLRRPDGGVEVLLWLPTREHAWPTPYVLAAPVLVPAGTEVRVATAAAGRVVLAAFDGPSPTERSARPR